VTITSARDAWAVGNYGSSYHIKTLILHWNGSAWQQIPSPTPRRGGMLYGITATSARSAWAAGCYFLGKTLVLRWNGTTWKQVPSPRPPPSGGCLTAAVAASPDTAWAVGEGSTATTSAGH